MALNIYSADVHYLFTTGAVTKAWPRSNQVDGGSGGAVAAGQLITDSGMMWTGSNAGVRGPYYARILKIVNQAQTPTVGATCNFVDINGVNIPGTVFTFAADAADKVRDFRFGGLVLPKGGFGVTTTSDPFLIVFTWDSPST